MVDLRETHWSIWLHRAAIVLATMVLLVGKVTTGRLTASHALPDIDIRLAALSSAILFELFYIFSTRALVRWKDQHLLLVVASLFAFIVYCCLAEMMVWGGGFASSFFHDLWYLAALVLVFGLLFRNEADLMLMALTAEIAAVGLFLFLVSLPAAASGGFAEQYLTSVTTFRIELVGLCGSLYLSFRTPGWGWKLLHAAVVICTIYAALASSSRTSILVLPGLLMAFVFYFLIQGRWLIISVVSGVILLGALLFSVSDRSHELVRELSAVLLAAPPAAGDMQGGAQEGAGDRFIDPIGSAVAEVSGPGFQAYCEGYLQAASDVRVAVDTYSCSRYVAVPDSTHRLRMMLQALNVLAHHPLFGAGADGFRLTLAYGETEAATYTYPHNLLLDVAARTGLIGILLFVVSVMAMMAVLVRAIASSPAVVFLCGIPLIYALASFTGGDMYDARPIWVVSAAVSAVCGVFFPARRHAAAGEGV